MPHLEKTTVSMMENVVFLLVTLTPFQKKNFFVEKRAFQVRYSSSVTPVCGLGQQTLKLVTYLGIKSQPALCNIILTASNPSN